MNHKEGLDYFPMECVTDENIQLVTAEFGMQAFSIIVMVLQKIYGENGYYCKWDDEVCLLFVQKNGLGGRYVSIVNEILLCCMRRGVFSRLQFETNHILTSEKIQLNYLSAVKRRKSVKMRKAYLLVKVTLLSENVDIIDENVYILDENVDSLKQSRVEKSINYLSMAKPPTLQQVKDYAKENGIRIDADKFFSYYKMLGWKNKNGTPVTDWKAAIDYWCASEMDTHISKSGSKRMSVRSTANVHGFSEREASASELNELERMLLTR